MKKDEAIPGTLVMVPFGGVRDRYDYDSRARYRKKVTPRELMVRGGAALEAVVLAYGRYRFDRSGICDVKRIIPSEAVSPCVVVMVQVPAEYYDPCHGNRRSDQERIGIGRTTEWQLDIYPLSNVMRADLYEEVASERRLREMDIAALSERRRVLKAELQQMTLDHIVPMKHDHRLIINKTEVTVDDNGSVRLQFEVRNFVTPDTFPTKVRARREAIINELADINNRLTCAIAA